MLSRKGWPIPPLLGAVALGLLLLPGEADAQGGCGRQQGRTMQTMMMRQYPLPRPYGMFPYPVPQYAALIALQQQQVAQLLALRLQQQNAMLAARQQPPPQNAMLMARPQQNPAAAELRAQPPPQRDEPPPPPEDPEATAARKLRLARELAADAQTAQQQGEGDRAARMRKRVAERLREIVARYPGTAAAGQAQELLRKPAS